MSEMPAIAPQFTTVQAAAEWAKVPYAAKMDALAWERDCLRMAEARRGTLGALQQRIATARGCTTATVRNKFRAWQTGSGSILALVPRTKLVESDNLNDTFLEFWKALQSEYQRGNVAKQAHRALTNRWKRWRAGDETCAIPGYDACPPPAFGTDLPGGWSYTNLCRHKPNKYQAALIKQGPRAASRYLPSVRTTREGLAPGQVIMWDDHWGDTLVIHPGDPSREPVRPVGFFAMDVASACITGQWWKPMLRRLSTGTREGLSQADFYWFMLHHLSRYGIRQDTGTMFIVEHGTAAIRPDSDMENGLFRVLGDKFSIDRSGRYGQPAFRGMLYNGPSTGNFRHKANLESFFNLLENASCAMEGAAGRNPDEKPEEQYGLMKAATWYLRTLEDARLSAERRALLASPLRFYSDFRAQSAAIVQALNERRDHSLQDWEACGHVRTVVQIAGEQRTMESLLALPPAQRHEAMILAAEPGRMKQVKLSPAEVWAAGTRQLRRLSGWEIAGIVPESMWRLARVTDRFEFTIQDSTLGDEPLHYIAAPRDRQGHQVKLERGKEYALILNPHSFDRVQVLVAAGAHRGVWLGECHLAPRVSKYDHEGAARHFGQVQSALAAERADAERYALARTLKRQGDKAWNDRVLDTSRPLTPSEHAREDHAQRAAAALEEFADATAAADWTGAENAAPRAASLPPAPQHDDEEEDEYARAAAALASLPLPSFPHDAD